MQSTGKQFRMNLSRLLCILMLAVLAACSTHGKPVSLQDHHKVVTLRVIAVPLFEDVPRLDVRRENPIYGIIGISAKAVQQIARESHRIDYQDANPKLHKYCINKMRHGIKKRLRKLGYRVKDLNMTYWQAQAAYRKKDVRLKGVDAVLDVRIKRFGYYSSSPFKPYRPGMVLTADLVSTRDRKVLSSNVYNVGYEQDDLSKFDLEVSYMTNIHVADKRYFYRNFKALMSHAKQSSKGLKFIAGVAAESVAGDLHKRPRRYASARK